MLLHCPLADEHPKRMDIILVTLFHNHTHINMEMALGSSASQFMAFIFEERDASERIARTKTLVFEKETFK